MIDEVQARVDTFLEFMKTQDGTPLVTPDSLDWLISNGFFTAPTSTKYHGNYEGGLFDHSLSVARHLVGLTESCGLKWQMERSPYIVGMFHDLCKIDQYRSIIKPVEHFDNDGVATFYNEYVGFEYNLDTLLKGHGDKSVMLLSQFYTLTEEEICCIRYHMGAFTPKEEWNDYTGAIHSYPNVLWTHHADMLASHVAGI